MSYVFNRSGGGGGLSPSSAVLHVRAPAGSTITLTKGGVTVATLGPAKSHVNAADSSLADWYYSIASANYGSWTVTAALGSDSASESVTVDSNKQYDAILDYGFYLFKSGIGEVITLDTATESGNASVTVTTDKIICSYSGAQNIQMGVCNSVSLDVSGYTTIHLDYDMSATTSTQYAACLVLATSKPIYTGSNNDAKYIAKQLLDVAAVRTVVTLDISSVASSGHYVGVRGGMMGNIYNLWLS